MRQTENASKDDMTKRLINCRTRIPWRGAKHHKLPPGNRAHSSAKAGHSPAKHHADSEEEECTKYLK